MVTQTRIDSSVVNGVTQFDTIEIQRYGIVCNSEGDVDIKIGECNVNFTSTEGIDGSYSFTDLSSVPYGQITSWLWAFGDGTTSNLRNPTHIYPCDKPYVVTLTITSSDCVDNNGQNSILREITVDGYQCCDRNPHSSWTPLEYNPGDNKIEYRYDLGSEIWPYDQRIKAEIKHYERRSIFKGWKKSKADIQASFSGDLFAADEDGCLCQEPRTPVADPSGSVNKKSQTFKDKIPISESTFNRDNWLRIKQEEPVFIDYSVNNIFLLQYNTATSTGYTCE